MIFFFGSNFETADSEVGIGNEEFAKKVKELELKLEGLTAELTSEREKVRIIIDIWLFCRFVYKDYDLRGCDKM